jgi:hypothetical protein
MGPKLLSVVPYCLSFFGVLLLSGCSEMIGFGVGVVASAPAVPFQIVDGVTGNRTNISGAWLEAVAPLTKNFDQNKKQPSPPHEAKQADLPSQPVLPVHLAPQDQPAPPAGDAAAVQRVEIAYQACNYETTVRLGSECLNGGLLTPFQRRHVLIRLAAAQYYLREYGSCDAYIRDALVLSPAIGISPDEYPPSFVRRWESLGGTVAR